MFSSQMMEKTHPTNYLNLIAEYAPSAIAVFDNNMRYIHVSQCWYEMFNLTPDIIGKSHYDIFPTIPEKWKESHRRGLQGEVIHKQDDFHLKHNGAKVWINWEIRPWYNDLKEIAGIVILVKDITEKIEKEEALKEGEQKFRIFFDHAAIGILQVSPDGKFLVVNPQFCKMTGYSEEELLGKTFMDITHPEDVEKDVASGQRLIKGEISTYEHEKRYVRKDGSVFWVYLTVTPFRDATGRPKYFVSTTQDITHRKNMEQALQESEQKFKAIFDQTAMGLAQVSLNGKIITANQKCCDLLGYPLEQLRLMSFPDFTHPGDVEKDLHQFQDLIDDKIQTYNMEKRYLKKNGRITWAYLTVSVVKDVNNKPLYMISSVHDISQRKIAELELQNSKMDLKRRVEERTSYLSLLQTISSEANKSDDVTTAFKISLHEICKLTKWQIGHFYMVSDNHREKISRSDLWCLEDEYFYKPFVEKTGEIHAHDVSIISRVMKTGKPFWSNDIFHDKGLIRSDVGLQVGIKSGMAFPVLVGEEVAGVLEFFSNINIHPSPSLMELMSQVGVQLGRLLERQKAKNEIELSQSRLQAVIDNLPARIYLKDRNKKYLLVNKVFKEFFRLGQKDLKNLTSFDVFPEHLAAPWAKDDDKVINEGAVVSYDIEYNRDPSGKKRTFHLTKFPVMDSQNNIYAFGGISIEITDLKEAEERMRILLESEHSARTEAEKAIGVRDEFISIASHELKSPITALKLKVQLLIRQFTKDKALRDNEEFKSSLCQLDHDADRLVTLINRLLDITRIQTGHFELKREEVVVNDLITSLMESMGPQLEISHNRIQLDMKNTVTAFWDKSRIEQVIVNLITNAVKFGEDKPIKLSLDTQDGWAQIKVEDQGRGIPHEFLNKIFDRYERANVKEGIQGLGLGLYIVKQILETHGGTITVESKVGKGSTFTVNLPLNLSEQIHPFRKSPGEYKPTSLQH